MAQEREKEGGRERGSAHVAELPCSSKNAHLRPHLGLSSGVPSPNGWSTILQWSRRGQNRVGVRSAASIAIIRPDIARERRRPRAPRSPPSMREVHTDLRQGHRSTWGAAVSRGGTIPAFPFKSEVFL